MAINVIEQIEFEYRIIRFEDWKKRYKDGLTQDQERILSDALIMLWQIARGFNPKTTALPEVKK